MAPEIKRLFFAMEVGAPWPDKYPGGRILDETHRHLTIAFLGNVDYKKLKDLLPEMPKPAHRVGLVGDFDKCLFLSPKHPHVVAWHVHWMENADCLLNYQQTLSTWLQQQGFAIDSRPFLPHATICRSPFIINQWKKAFTPLPCHVSNLHLYESIGNLQYHPIWSFPITPPFKEIEHTADIAFSIHAENISQLHRHAQHALTFRFPSLLSYLSQNTEITTLEHIVSDLNKTISITDAEIGCPFKAVSFHGNIVKEDNDTLTWEMIVDV